ncbi:hypothetical protein COY13_02055 [Candidatus Roizmanbacteria bacterium CG_4_10_14_0_2_um_filter_36_35]|uniref:TrpR like protein, YerC/YecD n=2 Tax=Candidatus Roizmaniibacteriota TaxID=1752723 RepID=A0A2M7BXG6_9BACT|nr:MAG: hypothetical protein COS50_01250 [Candidatus Roizmanbacteria bacterium CG03_land_8_20_14_0_80_35_26]PIZ67997.1 MAG: hypothetical protein COY13_02055 [Candidatus Roizmanbacteria bacterium CG_4_10_14_0_2_um_filter_36_35]
MTRISRLPVSDKVLEKLFDLFFEAVGKQTEEEEFSQVIYDLLSPTERIMIAKRVAIIYLLMKKIDYFNISDVLKVTPNTIAKFQMIRKNSKGIVRSLKNIVRNEKIANFFEKLFLEIYRPGVYGVNWKSAWKHKIDYERRKRRGI